MKALSEKCRRPARNTVPEHITPSLLPASLGVIVKESEQFGERLQRDFRIFSVCFWTLVGLVITACTSLMLVLIFQGRV